MAASEREVSTFGQAVEQLTSFLIGEPLTTVIGNVEGDLRGVRFDAATWTTPGGLDESLLETAVIVRRVLGRVSDVIHAAAILSALPRILEHGETFKAAPSLAAGNDPSRKSDLETDRRVAEFKLSEWKGADSVRKRGLFKDLVHLAAHEAPRRQLFVVGQLPIRFLESSTSPASWALKPYPGTRQVFENRNWSLETRICDFTAGAGVELVDLTEWFPFLASATSCRTRREQRSGADGAPPPVFDGPAWALLRDCADELGVGGVTFERAALIRLAQSRQPNRSASSLGPVIQGMTANASGGADPGDARDHLERVSNGLYRLNPRREVDAVRDATKLRRDPSAGYS